jgi:mono/diheme cytochrome c family protein
MRRTRHTIAIALAAGLWAGAIAARAAVLTQSDSNGWRIPAGAADQPNPIVVTPAVVAKGQSIYKSKCQKCHGETGIGNGPDADRDHPPGDLTDAKRASRNPDGVMFYKIWEGRKDPKMPAFKTDISRDDVWTVIHYVKTLRR